MSEELITYFTDLAEAKIKPPEWVVEGLIPVGLTVIGGPPKSYKSTLTSAIAAMVSGHTCEFLPTSYRRVINKGPILWFSMEADAGSLRYMLEHDLGVTLNEGWIHVCTDPWAWQLDSKDGDRIFKALKLINPAILILDPFRDMHNLNENDSNEMISLLAPLNRWAIDNKASIILVHHTSKLSEGQTKFNANNLRGSGAIFGKADAVLTLTPHKSDGRIDIDFVAKRSERWIRSFNLGMLEESAYEIPDSMALNVLRNMAKGAHGELLEQLTGYTPDMMGKSMALLARNGWLVGNNISTKGMDFLSGKAS